MAGIITKPSLNQISHIYDYILRNETLNNHFDLTNRDEVWKKLSPLTLKQVRYANALIINKKPFELNAFLLSLGFKQKYELKRK
jgi:hypothetical protein